MNSKEEARDNRAKGQVSEDRFSRILSKKIPPNWIIQKASKEENYKGVDFFVFTGTENISVDVKSSFVGMKGSLRKRSNQNVCIIVIQPTLSDDEMRKKIIEIIKKWEKRLFQT